MSRSGPGRAAILTLVAAIANLTACSRSVTEVDLIMSELPMEQAIARKIADLVDEDSGLKVNLIPPPEDSRSVLDALEQGYGDIAFAPNTNQHRDTITTIMPIYPAVLHVGSIADRADGSLEELLDGAKVFAGPPGSIPRQIGERIVSGLQLDNGASFTADQDAAPDVIILFAPIDRNRVMGNPNLDNLKLFSFGEPGESGLGSIVDRTVLLNPTLRPFVIPAGTYGALTPEPVVTFAVDTLLVAREDLDETLVFDLFEEFLRLRPALFSKRPELFQPIGDDVARAHWTFSLHPGALDYLQRDEPSLIERYSGVAEVLVTLLVGMVSGGFAILKIYQVRRKNRIDAFYTDVIRIRDSVADDAGSEERAAALAHLRSLRERAYEMLVDEQLAADTSFLIFVLLTNDAIAQIGSGEGQTSA
ncbi:MAG: hypothetical protein GWM88_10590 [Pseudomonadales bacterium]|nr:hypothetical protein [Pseudomonadales bacterium]NIX08415.1 hypothetical protein [Pseudomonadales bacterium]